MIFVIWDEALDTASIQTIATNGVSALLNPVPEPSSWVLAVVAFAIMGWRKRS